MDATVKDWSADEIAALPRDEKNRVLVPLNYPITVTFRGSSGDREELVSEIPLARPNGEALDLLDGNLKPMALFKAMIAKLSGWTTKEVNRLDAHDVLEVGGIALGFIPAPPAPPFGESD